MVLKPIKFKEGKKIEITEPLLDNKSVDDAVLDLMDEAIDKKMEISTIGMSFSTWTSPPIFEKILKIKECGIKFRIIVPENQKKDPNLKTLIDQGGAEIRFLKNKNYRIHDSSIEFGDVYWNDYIITKKSGVYLFPHNPDGDGKTHNHKGYKIFHKDAIKCVIQDFTEIWELIEVKDSTKIVSLNKVDSIVNNTFYEKNRRYLNKHFKNQWVIIYSGDVYYASKNLSDVKKSYYKREKLNDYFRLTTERIVWCVS